MTTKHNDNIAQKKNDDDQNKNEIVQPVQKQIDEFKSHYLQHFDPICCLGKGGFGIVFAAKDKLIGENYAIKRIPFPSRQESRDHVLCEVKALAKLEHKNIVKYFNAWLEEPPRSWQEEQDKKWMSNSDYMDTSSIITTSQTQVTNHCSIESYNNKSDLSCIVFDSNNKDEILDISSDKLTKGSKQQKHKSEYDTTSDSHSERKETIQYLYIKMELCARHSLREWLLYNKNRDKIDILKIIGQITVGVEYIHSKGLIHRDLKPSNIFFSLDNQIKIGDFGLVTKMINSIPETEYDDKQHTDQVGTQFYMSPEQMILGNSYDFKVDIYSLGIIFFELLNSFTTEMERCKTLKILRGGTMPSQFLKMYKDTTEKELVCNMLSQDPEKRYTTSKIIGILDRRIINLFVQPDTDLEQRFPQGPDNIFTWTGT